MAQLINEAKRMQFLAGLITEAQMNRQTQFKLTPEDQKTVNDILGEGDLQEGMFDKSKLISSLKAGLVTLAVLGTIVGTTVLDYNQKKEAAQIVKAEDPALGQVTDAVLAIFHYQDKQYKNKIDASKDIEVQGAIREINRIIQDNELENRESLRIFGKNHKQGIEKIIKIM
jgi:hypothetical protein